MSRRQCWRRREVRALYIEVSCQHSWVWHPTPVSPFIALKLLNMHAWNTRQSILAIISKETLVSERVKCSKTSKWHAKLLLGGLVLTVPAKLLCGGFAGAIAQTFSYPLDVTRRRMQLAHMDPATAKFGYETFSCSIIGDWMFAKIIIMTVD